MNLTYDLDEFNEKVEKENSHCKRNEWFDEECQTAISTLYKQYKKRPMWIKQDKNTFTCDCITGVMRMYSRTAAGVSVRQMTESTEKDVHSFQAVFQTVKQYNDEA
ncbi:unnamed protein product [Hermetia illucens]|uniref:Uncharacterized protein n=1 Tax=Hermetia illucens TaxID=343691 RepID=A0A7R8UKK9_HERIL|nr:unnamed protein product [Hermetia illucens]